MNSQTIQKVREAEREAAEMLKQVNDAKTAIQATSMEKAEKEITSIKQKIEDDNKKMNADDQKYDTDIQDSLKDLCRKEQDSVRSAATSKMDAAVEYIQKNI
ncbi:MAG: hypothetical protein U9Q15_02030 [Patescibacteria group bacterium]|nr:hypothetical protein [Patescibacteria group bacterium]